MADENSVGLREHLDGRIDAVAEDVREVKSEVHEIRNAVIGVVTWKALGAVVTVACTIIGIVWMAAN